MIEIRGGAQIGDRRLDRIYELDLRSLRFLAGPSSGTPAKKPRSYTWSLNAWLDQGSEGSCVGHGYAHELAAAPVAVSGMTHQYAVQQIYWRAQEEDPWEGGAYPGANPFGEGTSVLTGAKVLKDLGYYSSYKWGINATDIAEILGYNGPVVLGLNWYDGMFGTDGNGFIHPTGKLQGGHCICAVGVKIVWKHWYNKLVSQNWDNVDYDKSYVTLHNSWGKDWGVNGRAKLSLRELDVLMVQQGEAAFPVRTQIKQAVIA